MSKFAKQKREFLLRDFNISGSRFISSLQWESKADGDFLLGGFSTSRQSLQAKANEKSVLSDY
jgi:hypothetical protein